MNYIATLYPIDAADGRQQQLLDYKISLFIKDYSNPPDTLIIIYYAGHCYADKDREARWAA